MVKYTYLPTYLGTKGVKEIGRTEVENRNLART